MVYSPLQCTFFLLLRVTLHAKNNPVLLFAKQSQQLELLRVSLSPTDRRLWRASASFPRLSPHKSLQVVQIALQGVTPHFCNYNKIAQCNEHCATEIVFFCFKEFSELKIGRQHLLIRFSTRWRVKHYTDIGTEHQSVWVAVYPGRGERLIRPVISVLGRQFPVPEKRDSFNTINARPTFSGFKLRIPNGCCTQTARPSNVTQFIFYENCLFTAIFQSKMTCGFRFLAALGVKKLYHALVDHELCAYSIAIHQKHFTCWHIAPWLVQFSLV